MYKTLSVVQIQKFFEISGTEYDPTKKPGSFPTKYPNNNREWKGSPWVFTYVFEEHTGYFICELSHRMTNNRVFGWDQDGNELSPDVTSKHFDPHF